MGRHLRASLTAKIVAAAVGSVLIGVVAATVGFAGIVVVDGQNAAMDAGQANAAVVAARLEAQLSRAVSVAEANRGRLVTGLEARKLSRAQVVEEFRATLGSEPGLQGVWLIAEPNAFDGQDERFRGAFAASAQGEFYPPFTPNTVRR